MGDYGSLPLIPTSSPEFDRLLVEEDACVDIGGGPMHARGAPDHHHPSSSRAGYAPLNAPHAPLPDEGAAERIAQRVCTPRGVMIAALCAGAFYFGGASTRASAPGGWGAARVDGGNAGLAMARASSSSSPEVGGWEGRYAPRAARVPEGFQHRHASTRLDDSYDDAPWAPTQLARERHRRWTTTTTTDDDSHHPPRRRRNRSGSRSRIPRRAGSAGRRGGDDEDRRGSVSASRVRFPSGAKETRRRGGEARDARRLDGEDETREDTAGAGGGFDELERRIRATVFQP